MAKRKIIKIDEEKCNGCALCIPNCPEGALKVIDGKVRLISDLFCDGLGACIGHCPLGAITIEEREAEAYDEKKVMKNIVKQGKNTIKAHLQHLKEHNETKYLNEAIKFLDEKNIKIQLESDKMEHPHFEGCPGAAMRDFRSKESKNEGKRQKSTEQKSELRQWPVQLHLVPPSAPFFQNSDLLIAADCVPFADADFHNRLLKGKALAIGCPKLDDIEAYKEKIKSIIEMNDLNTITAAIMEVPCCYGLYAAAEEALNESGKRVTLKKVVIGTDGSIKR